MLLTPLALLLSALAIPIILMYVLKLRRQETVVPSTFLWRQALDDIQANAPWQRLRFNLLLLLQLLVLLALVFALARPAYSRSHVISGDLVVIVDESYGMQAHDVRPSRFVAAQARALTLASELAGGNVMSVIGMGAHPHLAIAESGDAGAIRTAIEGLHAGTDEPNFEEALSLAASLARAGQKTRAVVLTSRDSGIDQLPFGVSFPVDIERIGGRLHDLGIAGFSASQGASAIGAVARISNFGAQPARSDLDLYVDGHLADVRPLTVGVGREQNVFWTDIPSGSQRLQVRIAASDDVASDKSAWAVVAAEPPRRVLLVSRGDFFLESALADDPSIQLSVTSPVVYAPGMESLFDLVIFDGMLPPALPADSALLVAPPRGSVGQFRFSDLAGGAGLDAESSGAAASLLRYVDLSDVHVAQVRSAALPGWMQTVATSNGRTAIAAGSNGSGRYALVSFSLQRSDWPLRISFPVMLQTLVQYLAPSLTLGRSTVAVGQPVSFFPQPGARSLRVTYPNGATTRINRPFPPFTDTSRPGLYTVKEITGTTAAAGPRSTATFAVNFFPARPAPASGPTVVHAGRAQGGTTLSSSVPIAVIWPLEVLALLLLGAEWWVAFQGVSR